MLSKLSRFLERYIVNVFSNYDDVWDMRWFYEIFFSYFKFDDLFHKKNQYLMDFTEKHIISNLYGSPKPQIQFHSINPSEHSFQIKSISWTFELFFDQHFKWLKSHLNSNTFLEFSFRKSLHEFDFFVWIIYGYSWNSVI